VPQATILKYPIALEYPEPRAKYFSRQFHRGPWKVSMIGYSVVGMISGAAIQKIMGDKNRMNTVRCSP